jgi:uncharacterized protein (DUF2249 family)
MNDNTVELDVREDIRNGREPFSRIMQAVAGLSVGDRLLLIAPFEPVPLFSVLARQGFQHAATPLGSGDWKVLFTRDSAVPAGHGSESDDAGCRQFPAGADATAMPSTMEEIDVRGLEPPQPLIKILEKVATLAPGVQLKARTDRRPMHLYSHLEESGFAAETLEQSDGSYLTHIRRR